MNLGNYFKLKKENPKNDSYMDYEEQLNILFDSNLLYLCNMIKSYIDIKDLNKFSDKNFIKLCYYFLENHNKDKLFKDDNLSIYQNKFIIFQFVINFIYYIEYNLYYKFDNSMNCYVIFNNSIYNDNIENIYNPLSTLKTFNTQNNTILNKYDIHINFKILCEKIILFISLTNCKLYNEYIIPFDLIIYMILGTPKFTKLFN